MHPQGCTGNRRQHRSRSQLHCSQAFLSHCTAVSRGREGFEGVTGIPPQAITSMNSEPLKGPRCLRVPLSAAEGGSGTPAWCSPELHSLVHLGSLCPGCMGEMQRAGAEPAGGRQVIAGMSHSGHLFSIPLPAPGQGPASLEPEDAASSRLK